MEKTKRRQFIKYLGLHAIPVVLPFNLASSFKNTVQFGMVADVHQDIMLDGEQRLAVFIEQMNQQNVDFNIQLGDFCEPKLENRGFLKIWNQFAKPKYHVLGNHDMDSSTKEGTMDFWGMDAPYYSFDFKGFHFIVLDANYLYLEGKYVDYSKANFYIDDSHRTWINPEQLEWLATDLEATSNPTLVFSHQGLASDAWGIKNRTAVQRILEAANRKAGFSKVLACFNGHNHIDTVRKLNGIYYIDVNSMSYHWLGGKYKCYTRFPAEDYEQRPILASLAPYQEPLFCKVKIEPTKMVISGTASTYIGPSPEELGRPLGFYGVDPSPKISGQTLHFPEN